MYALHSIYYDDLPTYFLGFSVWEDQTCLDWDSTLEWFELLGITPVPILYDGVYNRETLDEIWSRMDPERNEGYVVRVAHSFDISEFQYSLGKYVRKGHVQTDEFWRSKPVVPNKLRGNNGRMG